MIRLENLSKNYNSLRALNNVTLEVPQGELFAYLGPNGAGKTTTIRILTGLTNKTSGNAWVGGYNIETEAVLAKRQCGSVPQLLNLDEELTISQNLDIHCRLYNIPRKRARDRVSWLLDYVGLADRHNSPIKNLSGGMKRRTIIARALAHEPKALFLDEPTVGLDPEIRRRIWGLIKKIQQDGTTVFLTTHYIEEAEFLADRVAFLSEGVLVALDSPKNLIKNIGQHAVDVVGRDGIETHYFGSGEEAKHYMSTQDSQLTMRRANLEDAFLRLTGKQITC
ncbi:MAG TPA: ABC transporter ATP-binding protein [Nitrospinota bacterium]|jgi:ABC-2 type transport system ATP-binding protein|nr:ABC transporter ATP-binding protein [Nitrospinota bacterium]|tara:strand:- start:117412 stop:118251 length:840 start_codon:yes stop_codon:yes gene_type:complete